LNFPIEHETLKTVVEYALILGLVIVLVIVALILLGPVPSVITNFGQSHV
jgi:Flp pilus assembly pilin Flp